MSETITATGTSEGARKGWAARFKGAMPNHQPHELLMYVQLREGGDSHGDAMRTIQGERQMASYQQSRGANKATSQSSSDVVRAEAEAVTAGAPIGNKNAAGRGSAGSPIARNPGMFGRGTSRGAMADEAAFKKSREDFKADGHKRETKRLGAFARHMKAGKSVEEARKAADEDMARHDEKHEQVIRDRRASESQTQAADESETDAVMAGGTSEGAKKGAQTKREHRVGDTVETGVAGFNKEKHTITKTGPKFVTMTSGWVSSTVDKDTLKWDEAKGHWHDGAGESKKTKASDALKTIYDKVTAAEDPATRSEAAKKGWEKLQGLLAKAPAPPSGVQFGGVRTDRYGEKYVHVSRDRSLRHPDEYRGSEKGREQLEARANAADNWEYEHVWKHIEAVKKEHGLDAEVHASEAVTAGAPIGNKNAAGKHKALIHLNEMIEKRQRVNPEKATVVSKPAETWGDRAGSQAHLVFDHERKVVHQVFDDHRPDRGNSWDFETGDHGEYERMVKEHGVKATDQDTMNETITAAGTSEGAKKGWEERWMKGDGAMGEFTHKETGHSVSFFKTFHNADDAEANRARAAHITVTDKNGKQLSHGSYNLEGHKDQDASLFDSMEHAVAKGKLKAADATAADIVHCRSHSAAGSVLAADKPWSPGEPVEFMWMPAGVHTICAGFRKGSIQLTVNCDQNTAAAVQASLDEWRNERPKQEPFGCIEHKEQEASFRVGATCGFKWGADGVYLAAEPTTLGAENVNGRVHRSWSPSFTTDADYSKATERNGMLLFPEGVRGSRSNPAQITGVDFCVGTLTNKPAFHAMSPVKASEGEVVQATWSDAARKAAAESRKRRGLEGAKFENSPDYFKKWASHHGDMVEHHEEEIRLQPTDKREAEGHDEAREMHAQAEHHYLQAAKHLASGNKERASMHLNKAERYSVDASDESSSDTVQATGTSEGAKKAAETKKLRHPGYTEVKRRVGGHDGLAGIYDGFIRNVNEGKSHQEAFDDAAENENYYGGRADIVEDRRKVKNAIREHHKINVDHTRLGDDSKAKASEQVHAHCAQTLLQDVPDATPAEIACYEKCLDDGGSHSNAVANIRAGRVADRHATALQAAEAIAAAQGGVKVTLADVEAKFTVQAGGTSEGAKKGWEQRTPGTHTLKTFHATSRVKKMKDGQFTASSFDGSNRHRYTAHETEDEAKHAAEKFHQESKERYHGSDATPQDILNAIYARAGVVTAAWSDAARAAAAMSRKSNKAAGFHQKEAEVHQKGSISRMAHEASARAYGSGDKTEHRNAAELHDQAATAARNLNADGLADQHAEHLGQHRKHAGL